ncbi:hypothetical protein KV557_09945 [Kitasatospora aureofaciens]|uniref:hypothetical protein n=1 Tax=Kitasatospora aureofaciens TaxID=1894 RepID=UPI001C48DA6B|nr:hypothetical protein [Kitasatospora aureofaciens]MBV6697445.1 hypothetical protein [Kitasatospora aureofaciens]
MTDRLPTLPLAALEGVWAAVYRHRDRLEAAAAEQVLAAWRLLAADLDLTAVMTALRQQLGEASPAAERRRHVQQVTAAAVLAQLAALTRRPAWAALIAALTAILRQGRAAGRHAGHAVMDDDPDQLADDDGEVPDDGDPAEDTAAAYTVTAAALRGTAQTIAGTLLSGVEQGDDERAMQGQADASLTAGTAWSLAAVTASAAAFTTGLVDAYLRRGVQQLDYVTAGDGRVCPTCSNAEDRSPWPANSAPLPPLHPRCRCTLQPTRAT